MFGNPISAGDYIVYAALFSRSAQLRCARVDALTSRAVGYDGKSCPTLRVCAAAYAWWANDKKPDPQSKPVTLGYLERCIVVSPSVVSDGFKEAISKVPKKGGRAKIRTYSP
jgi:hypothetical protein